MRINTTACAGILATAFLVSSCDKKDCAPAVQAANTTDQFADIRKAAESSIRLSASNPDSVRFRGIQVWPQASGNRFVVCGQANVFGPTSNTFVLFVATVAQDGSGQDPARRFQVETRVGSTVTEATKVYVETLARCHEGGGPSSALRREAAAAVPPMPDDVRVVLQPPVATAPPAPPPTVHVPSTATRPPAPPSTSASGTVVMRQNANIRAAPQGEVIRVEPQGRELRVFGEAPGGWLQIGDSAANGWVHISLVERR